MLETVPDILARIVDHKRGELAGRNVDLRALERRAGEAAGGKRGFRRALELQPPSVIAEVKKASPSKGLLCADFDPRRIAETYAAGGAAALSVLTDAHFFQGSMTDLEQARAAVPIPVLRKDFTISPVDILEAAVAGADAILLITAILDGSELCRFRELAGGFGMDTLVEVHNEEELQRAIDSGAEIIGVNNRDLRTFEVKLETSLSLAEKMPAGTMLVSESGIHSNSDVRLLAAAGYRAFLVGEHLMKSSDPARALEALRS